MWFDKCFLLILDTHSFEMHWQIDLYAKEINTSNTNSSTMQFKAVFCKLFIKMNYGIAKYTISTLLNNVDIIEVPCTCYSSHAS